MLDTTMAVPLTKGWTQPTADNTGTKQEETEKKKKKKTAATRPDKYTPRPHKFHKQSCTLRLLNNASIEPILALTNLEKVKNLNRSASGENVLIKACEKIIKIIKLWKGVVLLDKTESVVNKQE